MAAPKVIAEVSRTLPFSPQRAFDAWLDPALARKFVFSAPGGEMVKADIDARIGGGFNFTDRRDGKDIQHIGRYAALKPGETIAFTFHVVIPGAQPTPDSTVTLAFAPHPSGALLTLSHELPPQFADFKTKAEEGWRRMLAMMERTLEQAS
jgi:uncharacterized protein YndB with AHSA1/START domain